MATNNLLVNNESKVLYEQQSKIERSAHNLSQSRKFPCDVGFIYPFFCRKTLPSDSFKIWSNILIKQLQPLLVPQMVSFTVNTAFYWVDYSLAFPDFEYFLINQRGTQDIELPYVKLQSVVNSSSSPLLPKVVPSSPSGTEAQHILSRNLRSFLDISINESNEKVDALPFWTYQTIYRDFYLNIDRLSESEYNDWFPSNGNDWKLKPGVNLAIGNYRLEGPENDYEIRGSFVNLDYLRSHNVRGDYFVNSYPTPLRGDIPTLFSDVDIGEDLSAYITNTDLVSTLANFPIANQPIFLENDNGYKQIKLGNKTSNNLSELFATDNLTDGPSSSLRTPSDTGNYSVFHSINNQLSVLSNFFNPNVPSTPFNFSLSRPLQMNLEFTTRQLRLLESLTRKREIDILMKPRLKNYLQTYFGVNRYKDDSLYQPVFIGSTTQQILINDIAQTTATNDSPLGRQGATAISLGSGYVGEFYCRNYGCLMGVMYILPDYDYEPAIPKEWTERVPDEFVNPEFTHLSMSPILNKELFVSNDDTWNNEVLGYMGMYDNYRTSQNFVCGEFLNPNYQDIRQFAQVRRFDNSNKPEITSSFLNANTAFDKSVFSVPSLPPFIAQCVARVEAVRPLPQLAIPKG